MIECVNLVKKLRGHNLFLLSPIRRCQGIGVFIPTTSVMRTNPFNVELRALLEDAEQFLYEFEILDRSAFLFPSLRLPCMRPFVHGLNAEIAVG